MIESDFEAPDGNPTPSIAHRHGYDAAITLDETDKDYTDIEQEEMVSLARLHSETTIHGDPTDEWVSNYIHGIFDAVVDIAYNHGHQFPATEDAPVEPASMTSSEAHAYASTQLETEKIGEAYFDMTDSFEEVFGSIPVESYTHLQGVWEYNYYRGLVEALSE